MPRAGRRGRGPRGVPLRPQCGEVALAHKLGGRSHAIDFLGYEYKRAPSPISGRPFVTYDPTRKQAWHVPLFDELVPSVTVRAPAARYLIEAAYSADIAPKLRAHGITFSTVAAGSDEVEVFRAGAVKLAPHTFEGHTQAEVSG